MTWIKKSLFAALALVLAFSVAAPASAKISPTVNNTWSGTAQIWGATHFTVHTNASAAATVTYSSAGDSTSSVKVRIQRQICGSFGCSWKDQADAFVGGSCTVNKGTTKVCNFTPAISNKLHRVVITKTVWDGITSSGTIKVT